MINEEKNKARSGRKGIGGGGIFIYGDKRRLLSNKQ